MGAFTTVESMNYPVEYFGIENVNSHIEYLL
jgi:hypothetical protein